MGNLVKYGSYEIDEAAKEQEELDASGSGANFFQFKVGRNVIRVLPPPMGKRKPYLVVYQHFINVPGQQRPITFVCPRLQAKRFCPACKKGEDLKATGNPADAEVADGLFARRRVFANVIDRNAPEKGPVVAAFGKTIHEQLVALRTDEDAGGEYTHPEEGFDIIVERVGTGKNDTKYTVRPARTSTPLSTDVVQMQEWIDMQHNLDLFARVPSDEDLKKLMRGERSGGGDSGNAAPARGPGASRKRNAQDDIDAEGKEVE